MHAVVVGDVESRFGRAAALRDDRVGDGLRPIGEQVVDEHLSAGGSQHPGDALADPLPGAGDERALAGKAEIDAHATILAARSCGDLIGGEARFREARVGVGAEFGGIGQAVGGRVAVASAEANRIGEHPGAGSGERDDAAALGHRRVGEQIGDRVDGPDPAGIARVLAPVRRRLAREGLATAATARTIRRRS